MAITNPLKRKHRVRVGAATPKQSVKTRCENEDVLNLQQDPVPRLCVVLKYFHHHLTSLNNHGGIPVERDPFTAVE